MAMRPGLFSLSGLAVELGVDRRTVAAKLRNVRPDGNLPGGTSGWRLNTALRALDGPRLGSSRSGEFDLIADILESRLADPAIVVKGDRILRTVEETAQMLEVDRETVLRWLSSGAPYTSVGNWSNGDGFVVDLSWLVNWLLLMGAHLALMGRDDLLDALRIPAATGPTWTNFGGHRGFGRDM
jgi:hypothetical protein